MTLSQYAAGFLCTLLLWSQAATADGTQPSFDCLKASSDAEELICADKKLAALDRRLATRFEAAMQAARAQDAGADAAAKNLRATQRGWIKGRDDCWKAKDLKTCVTDAYLMREGDLVARWMLQEPAQVVRYGCNGNPADEVTVMFFDTELPSIRLEYGDGVDTGTKVRMGSGSRYMASFGRSIWVKGSEAMFAWEEGKEMACVLQ